MVTILGASGFVGSALAEHLQRTGQQVVRLQRPDFDLLSPETYRQIPPETRLLIHSAGHVGSAPQDDLLWKTNVESTYYLIQHLNTAGRPRLVIYLSSGGVYAMQPEPLTPTSRLGPGNLYAASKLLAERMFETMLDSRYVALRLFFPFGPGQQPPRLIPRLIQRIACGEAVELSTPQGLPVVNPIFIEELVGQIDRIARSPKEPCYNLGGPTAVSIRQLAEVVARCLGKEPKFVIGDGATGNLTCRPDLPASLPTTLEEQLAITVGSADYL